MHFSHSMHRRREMFFHSERTKVPSFWHVTTLQKVMPMLQTAFLNVSVIFTGLAGEATIVDHKSPLALSMVTTGFFMVFADNSLERRPRSVYSYRLAVFFLAPSRTSTLRICGSKSGSNSMGLTRVRWCLIFIVGVFMFL